MRLRAMEALVRLAARDPAAVAQFLVDNDVITWLLAEPAAQLRTHNWVFDSLEILLTDRGNLAWRQVMQAWHALAEKVSSRMPIIQLLQIVERHGEALQPATLASPLTQAVAGLENDRKQDSLAVQRAYGRLWARQWQADTRDLSVVIRQHLQELLDRTDDMQSDIVAMSKLHALGIAIQQLPANHANWCVDTVLACQQRTTQWALSRSLLPALLAGGEGSELSPATVALRATVPELLVDLPGYSAPASADAEPWSRIICEAIRKASLEPQEVALLLSTVRPADRSSSKPGDAMAALDEAVPSRRRSKQQIETGNPTLDLWLRADGLAALVVAAARDGHPEAQRALRYWDSHADLVKSPAATDSSDLIGGTWSAVAATDPAAFSALLTDAAHTQDLGRLRGAVQNHPQQAAAGLAEEQARLTDLVTRLLGSRRAEDARAAAGFWCELLAHRLLPPPTPRLLLEQLTTRTELRTLTSLVTLLHASIELGGVDRTVAATPSRPAQSSRTPGAIGVPVQDDAMVALRRRFTPW